MLIQGNFAPALSSRILRCFSRVLAVLLCVFILGALGIYGYKVHKKSEINRLARETRDLNERNRELWFQLNRVRSFKNVEAAAKKVPQLQLADAVIEVSSHGKVHLPQKPSPGREPLRVYGY